MARTLTGNGYFLAKKIGKAINEYEMIKDGDRVLVGVSGGKDSLTLLTILHERKKWVPIEYDIIAVHVQTDYRCQINPSPFPLPKGERTCEARVRGDFKKEIPIKVRFFGSTLARPIP